MSSLSLSLKEADKLTTFLTNSLLFTFLTQENFWPQRKLENKLLFLIYISIIQIFSIFRQVQTVSISYLRSLIEHVRCYLLDRDIELIYYTILKSCDVLTRDPMQLGAQVCIMKERMYLFVVYTIFVWFYVNFISVLRALWYNITTFLNYCYWK